MEEKKEIIASSPIVFDGLTLVPIIEMHLRSWRYRSSFSVFGSRQVIGTIIVTPTATRALKVDGEEVTLEELKEEFPALEIKLDNH
jgi:hypothetical protein